MQTDLGLNQDLINSVSQIVEASCSSKKMKKEELHPNQKVLDKNNNGKLDADDFKKLRKEEAATRKEDPPFDPDPPKKNVPAKNSDGTTQTRMSRVRALAKQAMKNQMKEDIDRLFEKDEREYGYEGEMVMTQLKTLCRHADHLMGMLKPETDLPEWVQSKITLATDYMQTSHDYLMSTMNESLDENSIADYYNKKRSMRDAEHKKQDPKTQASHYAKNMVDTEKAAKKAGERGIKIDARDFDYRVRNGVQRGKLPEEVELHEAEMSHSQLMKKIKDGTHDSVKEDVEQIDELSKGTLGSYVKKAALSQHYDNKNFKSKEANNKDTESDEEKRKGVRKSSLRTKGIMSAVNKLTKEQVEEIEALAVKHGVGE